MTLFFHGTNTEAKARSILEHGLVPDMPSIYGHGHQPLPGRVYMARGIIGALSYAYRPPSGLWSDLKKYPEIEPFGFIFTITGEAVEDRLWPDEDDVGNFMADHAAEVGRLAQGTRVDDECVTVRKYAFKAIEGEAEVDQKRKFWNAMHKLLTPAIITGLAFDCGVPPAGKLLLKNMSTSQKADLIRWGNIGVSYEGRVRPTECWKFRKDMVKLIRDRKVDFFEVAEQFGEADMAFLLQFYWRKNLSPYL